MLIPAACLASEVTASSVSGTYGPAASVSVAHGNEIGVPSGMPAPHWLAPVPASAHVVCPFGTTCQPWAFRIDTALAGLYGYGGLTALAGAYGVFGTDGTGP